MTRTRTNKRLDGRRALTLLEVVIALAIFLIAMVPIWHLVTLGGELALDVQQQAQASMLCQAKLDCVKSGAEPLNTSGTATVGGTDWNYTVESSMSDVENLYLVKVRAKFDRADGKVVEAVLTQFVLDPNQRGSTIATPPITTAATGGG